MQAKEFEIIPARLEDIPSLAHMNEQLIRDEQNRNPMTIPDLEDRFRGWLQDSWQALLITRGGEVIGYVLYQVRPDEYTPTKQEVYLRQFYLDRQNRRMGLGTQVFTHMSSVYWSSNATVILDVLETNPAAQHFWESLGFKPYCRTYRRSVSVETEQLPIYAGGFFFDPTTKAVLLHHRDNTAPVNPGKWGFFGGLSEGSETAEQCFIREMKEELSIDLSRAEIVPLFNYLNEEMGTHRYVFCVPRYLDKQSFVLGEGIGFDWISPTSLDSVDLTERTKVDIQRFFSEFVRSCALN